MTTIRLKKRTPLSLMVALILLDVVLPAQEQAILDDEPPLLYSLTPALADVRNPERYGVRNLFDRNPATCWALADNGIGQRILIGVVPGTSAIRLVNGYAKSPELFAKNNRLKKIIAHLYVGFSFASRVSEIGWLYDLYPVAEKTILELRDSSAPQVLPLPFDWKKIEKKKQQSWAAMQKRIVAMSEPEREGFDIRRLEQYLIALEIAAIFPGSHFSDTCLSDLEFLPLMTKIPTSGDLLGTWQTLRGADAEETTFEIDDGECRYYSYSGGRPWAAGSWLLQEGILKVFMEGFDQPVIFTRVILAGDTLTLVTNDGRVEEMRKSK